MAAPDATEPTADDRYEALVETLLADPSVSRASKPGFGSSGLFAGGKLFVMLRDGMLVMKLPRARVDALVASGHGTRFDPGHGRVMKEWLSLEPGSTQDWLVLAHEARDFAASNR